MAKKKEKKPFNTGSQNAANRGGVRMGGGSSKPRMRLSRIAMDKVFNEMMRHPTIRLATDVVIAMMMQTPWSIDAQEDQIAEFQWGQIEPYRKSFIRSAFRGYLKDGWRAFETRFGFVQDEQLGLRQSIDGLKALKSTRTDILVSEDTGEVLGLENLSTKGETRQVDVAHMILTNSDDDGFGELGEPLLATVKGPYERWDNCDKGAQRYDEKVAGGFLFIKYPVGRTKWSEAGGEYSDNAEIAERLGQTYRAAGWGAVPVDVDEDADGNMKLMEAWKAEVVAAAGGLQPGFLTRLKYCDAMMLRCFGVPERSTTEGTFGTKAESEAHSDIAMLVNGERHGTFVDDFNTYLMEPWNLANFGDPGASRLVLGKLDPSSRELFAQIFTALMADPMLGHDVTSRVDIENLLEKLQIPVKVKADFAEGPAQI